MEWPSRELVTTVVGGERLTACITVSPPKHGYTWKMSNEFCSGFCEVCIIEMMICENNGRGKTAQIVWNNIDPELHGDIRLFFFFLVFYCLFGGERWLGFLDLWSGQKLWWNWCLNSCGEFRWSPEDPVSQIHTPHLLVDTPGIFSDLLRFVQMLKREWGAESNGNLLHLFIPSKAAT